MSYNCTVGPLHQEFSILNLKLSILVIYEYKWRKRKIVLTNLKFYGKYHEHPEQHRCSLRVMISRIHFVRWNLWWISIKIGWCSHSIRNAIDCFSLRVPRSSVYLRLYVVICSAASSLIFVAYFCVSGSKSRFKGGFVEFQRISTIANFYYLSTWWSCACIGQLYFLQHWAKKHTNDFSLPICKCCFKTSIVFSSCNFSLVHTGSFLILFFLSPLQPLWFSLLCGFCNALTRRF